MLAEIVEEDGIDWLSNIVAEALGLEPNSVKVDVAKALVFDLWLGRLLDNIIGGDKVDAENA